MINFLRKNVIVFFLVLLVIILILLKVFYGNNNKNTAEITPIPSPVSILSTTPTVIPTQSQIDNPDSEKNLVNVLPYKGKKMQIAGYSKPGVLEVAVEKEEDKTEAEVEIKEWMEQYPTFKDNSYVFVIKQF